MGPFLLDWSRASPIRPVKTNIGSCFPHVWVVLAGLALLMLAACGSSPSAPGVLPRIVKLYPEEVATGSPFNLQPNGKSAIAIGCEHATPKTVVVWDGQQLETAFGSAETVSAVVPQAPYAQPGEHHVHLESEAGKSNEVIFMVRNP
jgi:hypothetical protein